MIKRIDAIDLSDKRIAQAREKANAAQISNINFITADIFNHDIAPDRYDMVLFDSNLHHFKDFSELLTKMIIGLKTDGILVINEYCGPDRFQFPSEQIQTSNKTLKTIPDTYRTYWNSDKIKKRIYSPGYLRVYLSDPSESINSSNMLPEIYKKFEIIKEVWLGGQILQLVLKDIAHHFIQESAETNNLLERIIHADKEYSSNTNSTDFIFGIYSPKIKQN